VEYAFEIMRGGSSADRQLATYERVGDLRGVVDRLVSETAEGVRPDIANHFANRPLEGEPYRISVLGDASKSTPPFASRTV